MRSALTKLLSLGLVLALLMAMLLHVRDLVEDRKSYRAEAEESVVRGTAGPQSLVGPILLQQCTESWQERRDGSVRVDCTIYVGRASQKAILIGDGGARIKEIGRRAREELTRLLERRVHLFLNVKERPGWDEERARLRAIGLHEEEG